MELTVSLIKDGLVIEREGVDSEQLEIVEDVIRELVAEARRKSCGPIWPFDITVREAAAGMAPDVDRALNDKALT